MPGNGIFNLGDGVNGSVNFNDGKWQGFNGDDANVIIDLGESRKIREISCSFLRDINPFIFLPESVQYFESEDGKNYKEINEVKNDIDQNDNAVIIKSFKSGVKINSVRYVRVKANNIKICPSWHKGAGEKAWIFIDEIIIN